MRLLLQHQGGRPAGVLYETALSPSPARRPRQPSRSGAAARRLEPARHCSRPLKCVCAVEPASYSGGQQDELARASRPAGVHGNRRVLLKISGEALQGGVGFGVDPKMLHAVAKEIATAVSEGVQVAVVVGGGNFFRGATAYEGLDRATADYVGMLATCMNSIMLQSALEQCNVPTRVQSAIEMREICEPWVRRRAIRHLERGLVVIFAAGTGNPFFTTDTAAALRAAEINADCVFKATKVDGVFDCDPETHPEAILHRELTYRDVIAHNLRVMDETAITICKENNIPVRVFNIARPGNIMRALAGDSTVGTIVSEACPDLPCRTLPEAELS